MSDLQSRVAPWKMLSSRTTYEDRWLKVRSDHCITIDGKNIEPFHVIEFPDWINVVPITRKGQLILVREYRHGRGEVMTGLVSGGVEEADEGDSLTRSMLAAQRELAEETGYAGGRFVPILVSYPNSANQTNAVTSFLALDVEQRSAQRLDDNEAIDVVLEDLASVMVRLRDGELVMQAMHIAALWSAVAKILAGEFDSLAHLKGGLLRALA